MPSLHWPLPTTSSTRSTRSASHLRRRSGWSLPASYVPTISKNLLNFFHYKQSNLLSLSLFFPYFHFSIKYNLQMCHLAGFLTAVNCWNVKWATRVQDVATVTKVGSKILTRFHFWNLDQLHHFTLLDCCSPHYCCRGPHLPCCQSQWPFCNCSWSTDAGLKVQ